jgi:hypothetical protein
VAKPVELTVTVPHYPVLHTLACFTRNLLWVQLLKDALGAYITRTDEIPQVYLPHSLLELSLAGTFFCRHEETFCFIENVLGASQPMTLLLYGTRRIDKTSLLNCLASRLLPDILPSLAIHRRAA